MRRPVLVTALVVGAPSLVLGAPGRAALTDDELGFFLGYEPPAECPSRAEFEQAVTTRTTGARVAPRDRATLVFEVEIATSSSGASALLVATLPDGTRARRDVHGESCSEAVATLAVIVALAIDGYRDGNREPFGEPIVDPPPIAPPATAEPPPPARAPAVEPNRVDEGSNARRPERRETTFRPGAFASVVWESAVAPSAPFGAFGGFELGWDRSGSFWPSLRAGVLATLTAREAGEAWSASFRLTAARVDLCPVGWGDAKSPSVHGCAELDGGTLEVTGSGADVNDATSQTMAWLAAGLAGRGEWPLATWASVEASAGFRLLANHDRFVFRPDTVAYDVPWFSVGLALGLVGRLP